MSEKCFDCEAKSECDKLICFANMAIENDSIKDARDLQKYINKLRHWPNVCDAIIEDHVKMLKELG